MPKKIGSPFPHRRRGIIVLLLSTAGLSGISCGRAQPAVPAISISSVMRTVREYGRGRQPGQPIPSKTVVALTPRPSHELYDAAGAYQAHMALVFMQGDFAQLEKEAREARTSKARLTGAVWKLNGLYEGVEKP